MLEKLAEILCVRMSFASSRYLVVLIRVKRLEASTALSLGRCFQSIRSVYSLGRPPEFASGALVDEPLGETRGVVACLAVQRGANLYTSPISPPQCGNPAIAPRMVRGPGIILRVHPRALTATTWGFGGLGYGGSFDQSGSRQPQRAPIQ